ncbi:hypothetical protein NQ315_001495 [Exocentrus adspersus]|uniref:Gustatory receptor n=1 Tax=Exocentrus adspersus TaxID=1586481 RepID=A0AAV8W946_9CUCU|nr:hypothetical protein NQ315_001495 [Exocentrus adspersus]
MMQQVDGFMNLRNRFVVPSTLPSCTRPEKAVMKSYQLTLTFNMALYLIEDPVEKHSLHLHKNKFHTYKQAFLQGEKPDVKLLGRLFRFYKFFLMTPLSLEDGGNSTLAKYFSVLVSTLCLVYPFFSNYTYLRITKDIPAPVTTFLPRLLLSIMNSLFLVSSFLNANTFMQENWRAVLKSLDQAEYILRKLYFEPVRKDLRVTGELLFIFIPFLAATSFQIYSYGFSGNPDLFLCNGGAILTYLCMCLFLFFMLRLNDILTTRYNFLEKELQKTVFEQTKDQEKVRKLAEIILLYKTFKILIDDLNKVLGAPLFFYVCVIVSLLLTTFSINMNVDNSDGYNNNITIHNIVASVILIISMVVLIMSCNSVEVSGDKLVRTCYMLHEGCDSQPVKDQVMQLAEYAEQWKPNLSAAGFYNVNQSTLSAIFEAVITYLVIIIQFNLALA